MSRVTQILPLLRGYPFLAIVTVFLIIWQHFGMNTEHIVFPSSDIAVSSFMDDINEGVSAAVLETEENHISLKCNVTTVTHTHAFCGIEIVLPQALDLRGFTYAQIKIDTETSKRDTTFVYLVNHEPNSGKASEERANMRTIYVEDQGSVFTLPMRSFSVPSWWLLDNPTDKLKGEPNLDKVTKLRITSGDSTFTRSEHIRIFAISFIGKYLSNSALYLILLTAWVLLSGFYAFEFLRNMKTESMTIKKRSEQLEQINRFLDLEKSKYKKMAVTDPLTGALNRAGIGRVFNEVLANWSQEKQPSALILIDLDNFKRVNDENGHDVGDLVLIDIVNIIKRNIRASDHLARWGGEEFAVICSNDLVGSAHVLAEKLRVVIENHHFASGKETCSFGVSAIQDNIEEWVKQADRALYESKRAGKNRVTVAE